MRLTKWKLRTSNISKSSWGSLLDTNLLPVL